MPLPDPLCENCRHLQSAHAVELGCQEEDHMEGRLCPCCEFEEDEDE